MSESHKHALAILKTLPAGFPAERAVAIARADADAEKAAEKEIADRRAELGDRPFSVPGRPIEPVDVIGRAMEAFAGQDAAEAERKREIMRRIDREYGL
jgi:hypothetical protein